MDHLLRPASIILRAPSHPSYFKKIWPPSSPSGPRPSRHPRSRQALEPDGLGLFQGQVSGRGINCARKPIALAQVVLCQPEIGARPLGAPRRDPLGEALARTFSIIRGGYGSHFSFNLTALRLGIQLSSDGNIGLASFILSTSRRVKRAWKLLYISVGGGAGLARRQIRSPRDENLIDRSVGR